MSNVYFYLPAVRLAGFFFFIILYDYLFFLPAVRLAGFLLENIINN